MQKQGRLEVCSPKICTTSYSLITSSKAAEAHAEDYSRSKKGFKLPPLVEVVEKGEALRSRQRLARDVRLRIAKKECRCMKLGLSSEALPPDYSDEEPEEKTKKLAAEQSHVSPDRRSRARLE